MAQDKDLKTPNVPPLRFTGFTDEWKECTIRDIAKIEKGNGISKDQLSEEGDECILYGELYTKYKSEIIDEVYSKTKVDSTKLMRSQANDVLIPCSGETAEDIATARCVKMEGILLGGDLNIMRFDKQDGAFMSYQLNGKRKYDIARVAQGVSVVHLYPEHLKSIKVVLPELEEQQKIVNLLSLIDERIATQNKIIEDLKKLKSAIIDKVFCLPSEKQPNERLDGFNGDWEIVKLSEICERMTDRNGDLKCNLVLTIAAQYGLVSQLDFFNKSVASENLSSYFVLKKGDFAYNKSYSGEYIWGAIKKLDYYEEGVLSPLYICFRPNKNMINSDFLAFYFESKKWYRGISEIAGEGARNHGLLNISVIDFFNTIHRIPSLTEQIRIATVLQTHQNKINNEERLLLQYQTQRKFLLSTMFI